MIDPNYLPFILAAGGVVLLAVFFHYVPFFLLAFCQSIRCTYFAGSAFSDAYS
mgnify:FL=1